MLCRSEGNLKSHGHCGRAGSSPAPGTIANWRDWFHENILEGWDLNTSLTSHTRCTVSDYVVGRFEGSENLAAFGNWQYFFNALTLWLGVLFSKQCS